MLLQLLISDLLERLKQARAGQEVALTDAEVQPAPVILTADDPATPVPDKHLKRNQCCSPALPDSLRHDIFGAAIVPGRTFRRRPGALAPAGGRRQILANTALGAAISRSSASGSFAQQAVDKATGNNEHETQ